MCEVGVGCIAAQGLTLLPNCCGRGPFLDDRQHLLGEQPQAALRHRVGRAAEAEGDVQLEIADNSRRSSSPRRILSGVPQLAACMKPCTAPSSPALRAISAFCW